MNTALCLRVVLLVASSISSHVSCTPPNAVPRAEERAKFEGQQTSHFGEKGFTAVRAASLLTFIVHIANAIALLTILSAVGALAIHELSDWLLRVVAVDPLAVSPAFAIGTLLMIIGSLIRSVSYKYLGRHFTFQLSIQKNHKLITSGPYSVIRHPGYTGGCVYMVGVAISQLGPGSLYAELGLWMSPLGFAAGVCQLVFITYAVFTMLFRVWREDSVLMEEFGEEWFAWTRRTPCRLIPGVY
ncbi:uncharacterized protein PHACADRAFT_212749 [Phanerochaete carnosa HHB-10118-sp]|uniref:Protein-S-isoprenylcysteine O-methyltransferase n=1 Tax=Phanerochaete carnosa (strain HHB-10118-sp) TaxID=650164 RepID=K5VZX4_PHACS|nr:uncharacterized protein PHACADRAFT_212749 [Phanerochaete carnosa HHB-10118-sp]EKM52179.1 hypothetical protein PHACADRAFT_212749 [Phanerochaete carnosa HHB-10118-sp]